MNRLLVTMLLVLLPRLGNASDLAAYDLAETDWNGLSSLAVLAEFGGYEIESRSLVDLDRLRPDTDILVSIHPTVAMNSAPLAHWVSRGGAALVADDFGEGVALLEPFDLDRGSFDGHGEYLDGNGQLPLVAPVGAHPISNGVRRIAMNHPSTLLGQGVPVFAFDNGSGAVYDISLGRGRAVVLADPSLLTNLMLPVVGNRQFVLNTLRVLCPDGGCRLVVVADEGTMIGSVGADRNAVDADVSSFLDRLVERLRNAQIEPRVLHVAALLLALGSAQLLLTLFPRRRPAWLDARIRPRRVKPLSEFEFNLSRFSWAGREPNLAVPASLLKARFEPRFYGAIKKEMPDPEASFEDFGRAVDAYAQRFEPDLGPRRRRALVRTLALLHDIPNREALLVVRSPWVDQKTLIQLNEHVAHIIDKAGLNDEFESDVCRPDSNS